MEKIAWSGRVLAVQPRIRLIRSFDQRHHSFQGYVLIMDGTCGEEAGHFMIAVGKGAHKKHKFVTGMELSGFSILVQDTRLEVARFYKTSGIKLLKEPEGTSSSPPPFLGAPPDLETYRSRGHRRLDARTYDINCWNCIWGCRLRSLLISGTRPRNDTDSRRSATARKAVTFIRPGPLVKSLGGVV